MKISNREGAVTQAFSVQAGSPPMRVAAQPNTPDNKHVWTHLLARNVKHFRTRKNLSQESLADHSGIFRTYLSRIETGKCNPSLSVLIALAKALEIRPHDLLLPLE
jgi:DNA-binding XRE family transcriptional regulator